MADASFHTQRRGYDGPDDVRLEHGDHYSADPRRALQVELANERAQAQIDREEQGYLPHPAQPRLDRAERRAIGARIRNERLAQALPRSAAVTLPHPEQPRLSQDEVRAVVGPVQARLDAWRETLTARREVLARDQTEETPRFPLRERDRGYSY